MTTTDELSELRALLEELLDDWGEGRLERVRDLVAELEAKLGELESALRDAHTTGCSRQMGLGQA